jgi:RNA polymerase sigma factor (sigma-70 family)
LGKIQHLKQPKSWSDTGEIIASLQAGNASILEGIYGLYRDDFLQWAGNRFDAGGRENFLDAWQDAVIAFYENVTSRKLTELHCSLRTYLFAIGCKRLLKNHRKMKRIEHHDAIDDALQNDRAVISFDWDEPWAEERELLLAAINELSPQCREALLKKYYDEKSLAEIQSELGYGSLNALSASLSRCLKKLKETIAEKLKNN